MPSGIEVNGVAIDSRQDCTGKLFFAIRGENTDGHEFIEEAVEHGAVALVVERSAYDAGNSTETGIPLFDLPDTLEALQTLASLWREKVGPTVIGITGSTGKTGTKELAAAILATRYRVHFTKGNLNNHIGLPLTILSMPEDTEVLVAEMGANHKNEIKQLASIARPSIGVITNIGPGHLEHFGSVKGVARAKAELIEGLGEDCTAVLPADDEYFEFLRSRTKAGVVSFGFSEGADFRIEKIEKKEGGGYSFTLRDTIMETGRYGRHHLLNAAAVLAAVSDLEITPAEAASVISEVRPFEGRGNIYELAGITFIDDSYNSNPLSLQTAIEAFMEMETKGRRWLVLGDMLELGEASVQLHAEMGVLCGKAGVDGLLTLGKDTVELNRAAAMQRKAPGDISHFIDAAKLAAYLDSFLQAGDCVLVKGSRGMRMESVISEIESLREAEKKAVD